MSDGRLVGYWSDIVLYQGAMAAADIAFASDRSGWIYWSRMGGVFLSVASCGTPASRSGCAYD